MLEVVFSDSVAGAMLVAIGHQHSVGGATAVILPTRTENKMQRFRRQKLKSFSGKRRSGSDGAGKMLSPLRANERTSLIFHWLYLSDIFPKPESGQSERKQSPC